jgi:hypothetical protein
MANETRNNHWLRDKRTAFGFLLLIFYFFLKPDSERENVDRNETQT